MDNYVCTICGHVYNPEKGEPVRDIPSGIEYSALFLGLAVSSLRCSKEKFQEGVTTGCYGIP